MRLMDPPACEPLLLIRRIRQKQLVVKKTVEKSSIGGCEWEVNCRHIRNSYWRC